MNPMHSRFTLLASAVALLVSACGGSSDTAPVSSVTLSGNAATGLAMEGASVNIKCTTGTATATTIASGFYTSTLNNAALPCVLKVTSADGQTTLHSVAAGSGGGTVVANLTPLTELVVAQAAGQTPEAFFNSFSSAQSATVSATNLDAAIVRVATALHSSVAIDNLNPLTATLVPATTASPTTGNAYDQLLDQLALSITNAQTSLGTITSQVASGSSANSIGASLQSTQAADFAAGIYDVDYDDEAGRWEAEVHRATSGPVNGVYPFTGSRYAFVNGSWGTDTTSNANRVLTANGWVSHTADLSGSARQVGLNRFIYTDTVQSTEMAMVTSSPATFQHDRAGTVTLPTGSKVFDFTQTTVAAQYLLNGGSGFNQVLSLADFRNNYNSSNGSWVQWSGGSLAQGALLQWRFGPGSTSGVLYLAVNYPGQNLPVLDNGSWEIRTVLGTELMVLHIPASVDAQANTHSGLATGQKFIYALTPEGQVQEGRYLPAGSNTGAFTNFNRTAANAIIAAIGNLASLPN